MKVLVIGNGGREHALAWKAAQFDQLQDGFLDEILAPWLPTTSTNNYRIALRKYQHYQRQTCT